MSAPVRENARRLAVDAVIRVVRDGLALALEESRLALLSPMDRALALEIAAGTVRHLTLLDAVLDGCMARPLPRGRHFLRVVLRTALYQALFLRIPARAALHQAVELVKASPEHAKAGFVNAVLRTAVTRTPASVLASIAAPVARLAVEYSHPEWLVARWYRALGEEGTRARLQANQEVAPLVLRVNGLKIDRSGLLAALAGRGMAHPWAPEGVIVTPSGGVEALPGYREGWFAVQDGSAQWPARLLDPQPEEEILDLCAAPGGKSMQLAALCKDQARILAVDSSAHRLQRVDENRARLGVRGVTTLAGDATDETLLAGRSFHRILADLPCSGTGVIRRHPEIKWRRQEADIERQAQLQLAILENGARHLRPGGTLVYAVCSLEPEEGEGVIETFLAHHPQWRRAPVEPREGVPLQAITAAGDLRFEPARDRMDGFFIARLKNH
ncbi:MAG: 16S rRNA (cytosine(967)-C(5))-methyltransferase RsmB [Magnetococcales bacterium]|nr:16S rRNA (cytosine(967)-C(5))-methyltransferase RsmB [Magnetococcales bacterium]